MARDDLHKRIEALNKRPLRNVPEGLRRKLKKQAEAKVTKLVEDRKIVRASEAPAPVTYARTLPSLSNRTNRTPGTNGTNASAGDPIALEEACEGVCLAAPSGGEYYHIEMPATDLDSCACEVHRCFTPLLGHPRGRAVEQIACVCKSERLAPEDTVFMDIETTGLGMTPVFLIGTMECAADGFTFKQYLARDYSEERGILSAFSERLREARMIITFNGKSFDMPYLRNRAVATGVKLPRVRSHLDLLHEARRHYGRRTPNHKLQTLEQVVCGRYREDDIPGALIPAAYHDFVRTGDARKIGLILRHNLHDLLTMADLMHHMWQR